MLESIGSSEQWASPGQRRTYQKANKFMLEALYLHPKWYKLQASQNLDPPLVLVLQLYKL